MIKSPEKQYNSYKILKVLTNQDYLAIDNHKFYYILSPSNHSHHSLTERIQQKQQIHQIDDFHSKILIPKECINLNNINYYVFYIGKNQVICADAFDSMKFKNQAYLSSFLKNAIRGILKYLLLKKAKQARKLIDIKNAIFLKGNLYLLQLDRGKLYPRSLQKSQKRSMRRRNEDSFRQDIENEIKIIKYFGHLLFQIVYKSIYILAIRNNDRNPTQKLISQMINQQITYQYLQINFLSNIQKICKIRQKKYKRLYLLNKNDTSNRYKTQSIIQNTKSISNRTLQTIDCSKQPHFILKNNNNKNIKTQIKQSNQSINFTLSKIFNKFNRSKISRYNNLNNSYENKNIIYQSNLKIDNKILKHNEQTKKKYQLFLDNKYKIKQQKDKINQNLKNRLINKLQRFKTQQKYYNSQRINTYSISQHRIEPYNHFQEIFTSDLRQSKQNNIGLPLQSKININKFKINAINKQPIHIKQNYQVKQTKQQQENTNPKQEDNASINQYKTQQPKQQIIIKHHKQITKSQLPKQQINKNQQSNPIQQQFQSIQLPQISMIQSKIHHQIQNTSNQHHNQLDNISKHQRQQLKPKKQIPPSILKTKKLISENNALKYNDQIQVIRIDRTTNSKKQSSQSSIQKLQPIKSNKIQNQKSKKMNQKSLLEMIQQFEYLISILGQISSKTLNSSKKPQGIEWKQITYFFYERFVYERQKLQQALQLGVKQISRNNDIIDDNEWQKWLISNDRNRLINKIKQQNLKIKQSFNLLHNKIIKQCKFDRKIQYYIRNRQKCINSSEVKYRQTMSIFIIQSVLDLYEIIKQKTIKNKEILIFLYDSIYGISIISQLDYYIPIQKRVDINKYQKYNFKFQQIKFILKYIQSLYFSKQWSFIITLYIHYYQI